MTSSPKPDSHDAGPRFAVVLFGHAFFALPRRPRPRPAEPAHPSPAPDAEAWHSGSAALHTVLQESTGEPVTEQMVALAAEVHDAATDLAAVAGQDRRRRSPGLSRHGAEIVLDQLRLLRHHLRTHGDRVADLTVALAAPPPAASNEVAQMASLVDRLIAGLLDPDSPAGGDSTPHARGPRSTGPGRGPTRPG